MFFLQTTNEWHARDSCYFFLIDFTISIKQINQSIIILHSAHPIFDWKKHPKIIFLYCSFKMCLKIWKDLLMFTHSISIYTNNGIFFGVVRLTWGNTKQNKTKNEIFIRIHSFAQLNFFLKKNTRLILINRFRNTKTKKHEIPFLYLLITNIANITFDINVLK